MRGGKAAGRWLEGTVELTLVLDKKSDFLIF